MKRIIIILITTISYFATASPQKESNVINLNKADFLTKVFNYEKNTTWKYEGDKPCIIDFYANWCRPCKEVAPIVEEIAKAYKDKIIVYKIDTDKESELFRALSLGRSIPTFLFIPVQGKPMVVRGAMPKEQFDIYINQLFNF